MDTVLLRFDGRDAYLRADGPAGAKTVLFLHPFPLDGSCWSDFLDRCARAGLRGAAVDAPGFGQSPAAVRPVTMDDLARLAAAALDALGARRATLVGCSMGGYAIFAFHRLFPERLAGAALVCTKASADGEEAKQRREDQARAALAQGPQAVTDELLPKLLSSPVMLERARATAGSATAQGIADALRGMALRPDSTADLPRWRVPALVVAGEDDQVIPASETDAMARGIPGASHAVIEGAGHLAFLEKGDEVWNAIQPLLLRVDREAPRR
jgi:pimeloyl-ACP methyl ester carboxylesterase